MFTSSTLSAWQDDGTNLAHYIHKWCTDMAWLIHKWTVLAESVLTWTLLRWDRCSSTWRRSLEGAWKMVPWCSIMKVTSLVASSSSKSISSTEPRTQCENICTIWTKITTGEGLETSPLHKLYLLHYTHIGGIHNMMCHCQVNPQ